jgi:hypothetical protein
VGQLAEADALARPEALADSEDAEVAEFTAELVGVIAPE